MTTLQVCLLTLAIYLVLAAGALWIGRAFVRHNARHFGEQNDAARRADRWARNHIVGALRERN